MPDNHLEPDKRPTPQEDAEDPHALDTTSLPGFDISDEELDREIELFLSQGLDLTEEEQAIVDRLPKTFAELLEKRGLTYEDLKQGRFTKKDE